MHMKLIQEFSNFKVIPKLNITKQKSWNIKVRTWLSTEKSSTETTVPPPSSKRACNLSFSLYCLEKANAK